MPILAVDENGQIYQTSPDRADGRGYGYAPECVSEGDVTLGSAYLKAQSRRQEAQLRRHRADALADQAAEIEEYNYQMGRNHNRRRQIAEAKLLESPRLQESLVRRAALNGCNCSELNTGMNGNGLTANGQTGWNGMSRDQRTIHNAITGRGSNTAYHVDRGEAEQARQKVEAQRILRLSARR